MRNITQSLSWKKAAVALIAVAAIVHLIFNYIHTNALLLLADEICGFLMFMFVLMGLVALFQATRIKDGEPLGKLVGAAVCLITDFFGYKLVAIYNYAIQNQPSLDVATVQKALWFSVALMAAFAVAAVILIMDGIREMARTKHG